MIVQSSIDPFKIDALSDKHYELVNKHEYMIMLEQLQLLYCSVGEHASRYTSLTQQLNGVTNLMLNGYMEKLLLLLAREASWVKLLLQKFPCSSQHAIGFFEGC